MGCVERFRGKKNALINDKIVIEKINAAAAAAESGMFVGTSKTGTSLYSCRTVCSKAEQSCIPVCSLAHR